MNIERDVTYDVAKIQNMELAEEAFALHVLRPERPWLWRVQRPSSWVYGFYVGIAPGAVTIYGDVGDVVLRVYEPTDEATLVWASRTSWDCPDYVASKMQPHEGWKAWYQAEAVGFARPHHNRAFADDVLSSVDELTPEAFYRLCAEHSIDDPPSCKHPSVSALWLARALATFSRLIREAV